MRADARSDGYPVHVLWLTGGLGCDGESIAMTAATSPSFEDLQRGCYPGAPPLIIHNPVFAYETADEFLAPWFEAATGRLEPFILVLEGSVPNEELSGDGHWAAFGVDPDSGDPITTVRWLDRLAPRAEVVLAMGSCAAYGGIPGMRQNPTGAMGLRDHLGWSWTSCRQVPVVNLPGCPVQPDNITETLLRLALYVAGAAPMIELDDQGRPTWLFARTVQQGCGRAGFAEQGEFARTPADARGCLVKLGCKGPVAKCNVPLRGWMGGVGGCPNVGGICIACTMPGFPDKFMPFMEANPMGVFGARTSQFTYGPVLRRLRHLAISRVYDREPVWRGRSETLKTGYEPRW
ncbi:MAG TPA: hydrogenase expression protein HypE [Solirubrobacteraceae bacterium]|nr:hydrogenase expression protein HypE [Solirubrobacteraceae bacterium]